VLKEFGVRARLIVHQTVFEFEFEEELEECVLERLGRAFECGVESLEGLGEVCVIWQRLFVVVADFVEGI
jgi:hypothetical protein